MKDSGFIAHTSRGEYLFSSSTGGGTVAKSALSEADRADLDHVPWGDNDDFPVLLTADAEKDTVITPGIRFKSEMHYGGGVTSGKIEIEKGKEIFTPTRHEDFIDFQRRNNIDHQLLLTFYDLNYQSFAAIQLVKSTDGKSIARYTLANTRAKHCRLSVRDKDGRSKWLYINADFGTEHYKKENTRKLPIAPEYDAAAWFKASKHEECVVIVKIPDSGRQYYPVPDWNTSRKSEWYEISQSIAKFKKYLMQNQMSLKYHVEIHPEYWPLAFGADAWNNMDEDTRKEKVQAYVTEFADFMTKPEAAGKAWLTTMGMADHNPEKAYSHIKITELGSKISKDSAYIEDSLEASKHKMSSMGLHPELLGNTPSSQLGAGSGSGNRVAFNQRVGMSKPTQDLALWPLGIVRDYNGWDKEIIFRMRNSLITTLDKGAEATKPSANNG